jgi:L-ascorbate metabolism protein UlaG (beta-lactamase superfamily)
MRIRWFGQSAFLLTGSSRVAIDPFGDVEARARERGLRFAYPGIEGVEADVLLISHEHFDHNGADAIGGDPHTIRSTAGTFETPIGEVRAIASEHDDVAGTRGGPNAIFALALDGLRLCHFGDFGQAALRPEQRAAIGAVDVLMLPVGGGGPTIGGAAAAAVVRELAPRLVIPMHYRTDAVSFLEPPDAFLAAVEGDVRRLDASEAEVEDLLGARDRPVVALLAPPLSPA